MPRHGELCSTISAPPDKVITDRERRRRLFDAPKECIAEQLRAEDEERRYQKSLTDGNVYRSGMKDKLPHHPHIEGHADWVDFTYPLGCSERRYTLGGQEGKERMERF